MEADGVAAEPPTVRATPWRLAWSLAARRRLDLVAVAAAAAGILAFHYSGAAAGARDSFVFMGFDLDRAYLLIGGMAAVLGGALAALAGGRRFTWVGSGLLGLAALFGRTFLDETGRALTGAGGAGHFDVAGWALTAAALVTCGLLLGLGAGILGSQARSGLVATGRGLELAWRARDPRTAPRGRLLVTVLLIVGLLVAIPVAGQLLNFGPDSLMLAGGAEGIPLTGEGGTAASVPPSGAAQPSTPRASAGGVPSPHPTVGQAPWLAWRPSGQGTVLERALPAPWTGGTSPVVHFAIYLPPGYGSGGRRYPVVYELPWPITLYDNGADIRQTLDNLIDGGEVPASIVVFLSSGGGPFIDNECIDAAGGREPFDAFAGTTLVHYLDTNFRTIPVAAARTLLGDSQGGFCAANVLLHHPEVFRQEISFSGYYTAAPILGMSPSAQAPYAGDRVLELANSPMLIDTGLVPALRRQLLFTLIANPQAPFYGAQYLEFGSQAQALGYLVDQIPTPYGHSWLGVRVTIGPALRAIADREAAEGVFAAS
jgi:hypothetical protein